jgi:hypothetical protein
LNLAHGHAQFLSGGLRKFGTRTLTHFHLSGEHRHHAIFANVNALPETAGLVAARPATTAPSAAFLRVGRDWRRCDDEARSEELNEGTPPQTEGKLDRLDELIVIVGERICRNRICAWNS